MALICCDACGYEWISKGAVPVLVCKQCRWRAGDDGAPVVTVAPRRRGKPSDSPTWWCGGCERTYQARTDLGECRRCAEERRRGKREAPPDEG